jgi:membrane protein required for beta-lactamase induction
MGYADRRVGLRSLPRYQRSAQAWADSLDSKLVAVFGVGSALVALVPSLQQSPTLAAASCWVLALVFWLIALGFGYYGYRPAALWVGPSPRELLGEEWLRLPAHEWHL